MGFEFDDDTAVTPLGAGAFRADLTSRWNVGDTPNGGYLLAVALRAAGEWLPHPHPFTSTVHYLRRAQPGAVNVEVDTVRTGRTLSTADVRMFQGDAEILRVLTTFGDLAAADGPTHLAAGPPDLPALEECQQGEAKIPGTGAGVAIADRFELALDPATLGWAVGRPSGIATVGGWVRFVDGREVDPLALTLIVDGLPPPVFNLGAQGWVPTIELTVHVRAVPAPGWLRIWGQTRFVQGGYLEEDVEIWDRDGRLVAQSRQLARVTGWAAPGQ